MSTIDLDQARERLRAERGRLEHQLDELLDRRAADGPIDMLSGDSGQDTSRVETELGMEEDLRRSLDEIGAALKRIDDGTYGYDVDTGEPIDPERLAAVPTARRNIR
jgi:DnaK suppressor protein